jgi:hypothetical protein
MAHVLLLSTHLVVIGTGSIGIGLILAGVVSILGFFGIFYERADDKFGDSEVG